MTFIFSLNNFLQNKTNCMNQGAFDKGRVRFEFLDHFFRNKNKKGYELDRGTFQTMWRALYNFLQIWPEDGPKLVDDLMDYLEEQGVHYNLYQQCLEIQKYPMGIFTYDDFSEKMRANGVKFPNVLSLSELARAYANWSSSFEFKIFSLKDGGDINQTAFHVQKMFQAFQDSDESVPVESTYVVFKKNHKTIYVLCTINGVCLKDSMKNIDTVVMTVSLKVNFSQVGPKIALKYLRVFFPNMTMKQFNMLFVEHINEDIVDTIQTNSDEDSDERSSEIISDKGAEEHTWPGD